MTLSDLAKYSMTRSIIYDNRASCFCCGSLTFDIISTKVHIQLPWHARRNRN